MLSFIENFIATNLWVLPIMSVVVLILAIILIILAYKVRSSIGLKYEFVSIISHKFRTPLTSVKWSVDNLISSEKDGFRRNELEDVHRLNQELIGLTNTLIELTETDKSSKHSYNFEIFSACDFIRETAKPASELFGIKNITFSVNCADENIKIKADRTRLEFVVHALLENSSIYTPAGGKVDVVVEAAQDKIYITVVDNGIGIPKKNLRYIFSEFHRAPNAKAFDTEGLGVDLFLAKRIVHRLGGQIKAFSEGEAKGSTFQITLPSH